ncbi:hypothetical protein R1sor_026568 [Riccia sorocarpa]|uniref:Reverse transcriptase domain-containing protein n=1 Tax=Riccia sorocarpa TaxID=122646 RepID=A0ABD3GBU1_9MARC
MHGACLVAGPRAVNTYGPAFDDSDPENLKQVITVLVHKADKFVASAVEEILAPVGKVLHSYFEPHGTNQLLKAVTLSSRPSFITELEVPITAQVSFTLKLDYEGLQLRCRLCLSVSHSALDCPHRQQSPRPPQNRDPGREVRERLPNNRGLDLNSQPPPSESHRRRPIPPRPQRRSNSDSSDSTGSSIHLYEEFRTTAPTSRRSPSISKSTSAADTAAGISDTHHHRNADSQFNVPNTAAPQPHGRFTVYSAYVPPSPPPPPPPIAARIGNPSGHQHLPGPSIPRGSTASLTDTTRKRRRTTTEEDLPVNGGKGGIIVAVSPSLSSLVTGHGTLPLNAGLWLHIDLLDGTKLGFLAVYAPHSAAERTQVWANFESSLDGSRNWIMAGDFNMISDSRDQLGGTPRPITGEELHQWNSFCETFDLSDTFQRTQGAIKFTWDNRRHAQLLSSQNQTITDAGRVLKRLDRVYADSTLQFNQVTTQILPRSELSDHLPVIVTFHIGSRPGFSKSCYRMNISALQDPKLKVQLQQVWTKWQQKYEDSGTPALTTLKQCIKRAAKYCQIWGKHAAKRRKEKQDKLTLKVHGLILQLQANPANVYTEIKLEEARTQLATWEADKARWTQTLLDRKWEDEGEKSSKLFFNSIKSRKRQTAIHALQDDQGSLHTDEDTILQLAAEYFSEILQEPPPDQLQHSATEELISQIKAQVSTDERLSLQKVFSSEELHAAAKLLGRNKCPGPDEVPLEFFLVMWDTIAPLLLKATTEGLQQCHILPFFNSGVITLLQKDGDQTKLQNKRPITLLNAVYKIWAKTLQLRLTPVLQRLITWEQNAFIPGRQLHTTVLLCNEAVYEAKKNQMDSVLLKIDFRKAFDTLRWDFLYAAMAKMEFGDTFISFFRTLNSSASSAVRINTECSRSFQISRSVRQGCPLSPLLFTIAIQVLTDTINGWLQTNQLQGIELQSINTHYCQGYFADDAHFLHRAEKQNLLNAKSLLHTFGLASGLTVQWGKSKARWISTTNLRPNWTEELHWVWSSDQDVDKFLGFQFRDSLDEESIYEVARQKVLKKINCPFNRSTTIHGRVVIANHIIYGILWFVIPLWSGNRANLRNLEKLILSYVWGGNETTHKCHRVAENLLHQRKQDGGLGLISLQAQMQSFLAKLLRWAYVPGAHPLKAWLIAQFNAVALLRWGATHYTWVTSPSKGSWPTLSPIMLHVCKMWQSTAKLLAPLHDLPLLAWKKLSLWGPKVQGVRNISRSATRGPLARLNEAGVDELGHITLDGSTGLSIQEVLASQTPTHPGTVRAFERVIQTTPKHTATYRCPSRFAVSSGITQVFCIQLTEDAPAEDTQLLTAHALAAFRIQDTRLIPNTLRILQDLPPDTQWTRIPVATCWNTQSKPPSRFLVSWDNKLCTIATLQWRNQSNFLVAPNTSIRRIAVPTNLWRHPQASRDDEDTWCKCCPLRAAEDIPHLFWTCPSVLQIWGWAVDIFHTAFPETRTWTPRFRHAVLGAEIPVAFKPAAAWWDKWRIIILWTIWVQRNNYIFRDTRPSQPKAKADFIEKLFQLKTHSKKRM